jgi:hypothetical protein
MISKFPLPEDTLFHRLPNVPENRVISEYICTLDRIDSLFDVRPWRDELPRPERPLYLLGMLACKREGRVMSKECRLFRGIQVRFDRMDFRITSGCESVSADYLFAAVMFSSLHLT